VTVAGLSLGQGYVRCGRCSNVFNALLTLSEERDTPAASYESAAATQSRPALSLTDDTDNLSVLVDLEPDTEESLADSNDELDAEELEALEDDSSDSGDETVDDVEAIPETALEFDPTSTDLAQVFVEPAEAARDETTGVFETIVLSGEEA